MKRAHNVWSTILGCHLGESDAILTPKRLWYVCEPREEKRWYAKLGVINKLGAKEDLIKILCLWLLTSDSSLYDDDWRFKVQKNPIISLKINFGNPL